MTSGNDQLQQRWSFTAPSANLPGARPRVPSTTGRALRSSLVAHGTRVESSLLGCPVAPVAGRPGATERPVPTFRPVVPVVDDEDVSVALAYRRAAEATLAETSVEDASPSAPVSLGDVPVMDPYVPTPPPGRLVLKEAAAARAGRAAATRAKDDADKARQLKVGGISVFAAVLVVVKLFGVLLPYLHR